MPRAATPLARRSRECRAGFANDYEEYDASHETWSQPLRERIRTVQEEEDVRRRLEELPVSFVLVFDVDTSNESVYSVPVAEVGGDHCVLAFEARDEAQRYANTLNRNRASHASVQALDVEALVVTSRDAHFRVGMVFKGDLVTSPPPGALITTGSYSTDPMKLLVTVVPEGLFEGKCSSDYLDPATEPVWVIVRDEGTSDAEFFRTSLNGKSSIVVFRDEAAASRCRMALALQGGSWRSTQAYMLDDLVEKLDEDGLDDVEVCLVDEVIETILDAEDGDDDLAFIDGNDEPIQCGPPEGMDFVDALGPSEPRQTHSSAEAREMLARLFRGADGKREGGGGEGGGGAP